MKVVYFCHPLSGSPCRNKKKIVGILRSARIDFNKVCFIVPQLYLGKYLRSEKLCMQHCFALLEKCDEVWVFGHRISKGMRKEISLANKLNIPVVRFKNGGVGNDKMEQGKHTTAFDVSDI